MYNTNCYPGDAIIPLNHLYMTLYAYRGPDQEQTPPPMRACASNAGDCTSPFAICAHATQLDLYANTCRRRNQKTRFLHLSFCVVIYGRRHGQIPLRCQHPCPSLSRVSEPASCMSSLPINGSAGRRVVHAARKDTQ